MRETIQRLTAQISARLPDPRGVSLERLVRNVVIGSLLVHLLIISLFVWLYPEPPVEVASPPVPPEIVMLIVPPPPPPEVIPPPPMAVTEPPMIDANGLEKSAAPPKTTVFQSSQDMLAGSERAGKGSEPLPSQDGVDLPSQDFKTQAAKLGKPTEPAPASDPAPGPPLPSLYKPKPLSKQYLDALAKIESSQPPPPTPNPADPVPEPAEPSPPPPATVFEKMVAKTEDEIPIFQKPADVPPPPITKVTPPLDPPKPVPVRPPAPAATPAPELAMLTPPTRPQPVRDPGYQPDMRQARIEGSISNRRKPGVDAVKTPLGVYRAAVSAQIQSRWLYYTKQRMDLLALGTVRVRFFVTQEGRVQDIRILENDSNQSFANVCEESVRDAEIKPPPADLEMMNNGRLELVFSFTLYNSH